MGLKIIATALNGVTILSSLYGMCTDKEKYRAGSYFLVYALCLASIAAIWI